ncbi:putative short chain [Diaporthe ampelina]|uniref:Putative short chain n=1 Tax=Diaporthe ampelina TaxID=1214573 RepID=A0A0G2F3S6_9PEZI|nr:putative short chain [Diaporthe ampelina]
MSSPSNFVNTTADSQSPWRPRQFHATASRSNGLTFENTGRLPEFSLRDKVIVVTGAGRGLGLVQSEALLEAGAKVYALDRLEKPDPGFHRVQERAKELGTSISFSRIDVRDNISLNATVERIADENGRIDGLLACAGIQQETPALEYTMEDADKMFGVNITGVFMTAQAVARQMRRLDRPGSMVFIGSMSGTVANKGLICPAYNASKAGVLQLARNLAMEWGSHGIRVNTISPGYIVTAMTAPLFEQFPDRKENWPKQNMLGRLSYPEEYRGAAVFLLSDASSFMTGADLRMDGGHTAW